MDFIQNCWDKYGDRWAEMSQQMRNETVLSSEHSVSKWGIMAREQGLGSVDRNLLEGKTGISGSGYTDLTGFLLKSGQGEYTSPERQWRGIGTQLDTENDQI